VALALCGSVSVAWTQNGEAVSPVPAAEGHVPACIFGVVTSETGELYGGVRVTLTFSGQGAAPAQSQTTESNGAFNFADVTPGTFTLMIASNGFTTQTISGVLRSGEQFDAQTVVLPMAAATSVVRVTASQPEGAVEELHEEEHQRVLGVIPNFYVTYVPNAPPLTARQKYVLALKSSVDPYTWLATGAVAGIEQAGNGFSGYGQGAQGYAKRYGATYATGFINTMLGGAVLPAMFKQDPRYFYKGTGTIRSRVLYAIANAVACKGDNGHSQFDYTGILGSLAAGGIANLYYPASDRAGVGLTFENAGLGIAGSVVGNLLQEFVVKRLTPKLPHQPSNP